MKRTFLFLAVIVSFFHTAYSQKPTKPTRDSKHYGNLSTSIEKIKAENNNENNFGLKSTESFSPAMLKAIIKVSENFNNAFLLDLGVVINSTFGEISTVRIPIEKLESVLSLKGVEYVEVSENYESNIYRANEFTQVDSANLGVNISQAYTGKGVIVGIIDNGFDYTHPNFFSADYSEYRISRVWEQDPSGVTDGNEYVGMTEIYNKGASHKNYSHGTHVAGIATGSGSILPEYRGVAFESEIVLVTANNTSDILDGIKYVFDYAESVSKPAVVNISKGNLMGPHDGTSYSNYVCDNFLSGKGNIIVTSAGNSGNKNTHIDYTFSSEDTLKTFIHFLVDTTNNNRGSFLVDIWGEPETDFSIAVKLYDTLSKSVISLTEHVSTTEDSTYFFSLPDSDIGDSCYFYVKTWDEDTKNGNPHICISFDSTDKNTNEILSDYLTLEIAASNTFINAWTSTKDAVFTDLGQLNGFAGGNNISTISDGLASAKSVIAVGSYNSTNEYKDRQNREWFFADVLEDISDFSSLGATIDGRIKPDIIAPGSRIISSVSSFDSNYKDTSRTVVAELTNGSRDWFFAVKKGTSMSAPVVTGIVALMLEANPTLTPAQVKEILNKSAMVDSYTGAVPNNTWGYGKVNALEAIQAVEEGDYTSGILTNGTNKELFSLYPNPSSGEVTLKLVDANFNRIVIFDISGKQVYSQNLGMQSQEFQLDLSNLSNGMYLVKLFSSEKSLQQKLIISNLK